MLAIFLYFYYMYINICTLHRPVFYIYIYIDTHVKKHNDIALKKKQKQNILKTQKNMWVIMTLIAIYLFIMCITYSYINA